MSVVLPPFIAHFATLAGDYDVALCDVWGVVHNGVVAAPEACDALTRFRERGGTVVLITNAPRPGERVARGILDHLGVSYKGLNVLESDDLREGIKSYSNWPTIPQLYVKGEFVGGCDIIREMFQAGELQGLLKEKGVALRERAST